MDDDVPPNLREQAVEDLIEMVKNGEGLLESLNMLSKKHQRSVTTLKTWYYEDRPPTSHHGNRLLTEEQEQQLLYSVIAISNNNMDWSEKQVQDAAQTLFDVDLCHSTVSRFLKRHSDTLSFQKTTSLGSKRITDDLYEKSIFFAEKMAVYFEEKGFAAREVINYDECRICLSTGGKLIVHRYVSKQKVKPQHQQKVKSNHVGTYLPFVSADGQLLASYFIFKSTFDQDGESDVVISLPTSFSRTRRGLHPPTMFWTDRGYLTKDVFHQIMDHFTSMWQTIHPGLHCCVIGDNLSIHRNLSVIQKCLQNKIYMCYLVANTTHWSQPLDNLLFARLKQEIARTTQALSYAQVFTDDSLFSLVEIVLSAARRAFIPVTVKKAFNDTNLLPFFSQKN